MKASIKNQRKRCNQGVGERLLTKNYGECKQALRLLESHGAGVSSFGKRGACDITKRCLPAIQWWAAPLHIRPCDAQPTVEVPS